MNTSAILCTFIEKLEDMKDIYIATKRVKDPGKIWTMEELEKEIDFGD